MFKNMTFISTIRLAFKELGARSLIQTVRFNVHYFGRKLGLQLPVFVYNNVYFKQRLGNVELQSFETGNVKIGKCIIGVYNKENTEIQFNDGCSVYFGRNVTIGSGCKISVQGQMQIFDNVCITGKSMIVCSKNIEIGANSLISWNVQIMDTDLHKLFIEGTRTNYNRPVLVGENVWINSGCIILKGTTIANNSVVGANSLLNKKYEAPNCLIIGNPAQCVRQNIKWER